jgi:hypothetical protein
MTKKNADYGSIFWFHLGVNLVLIFSWLLFSWWIIILGSLVLQLQYKIFGGCILSRMEFGKKRDCMVYYLNKWGFVKDMKKSKRFVELYLHIIVIILSLILQIALGFSPIVF